MCGSTRLPEREKERKRASPSTGREGRGGEGEQLRERKRERGGGRDDKRAMIKPVKWSRIRVDHKVYIVLLLPLLFPVALVIS